MIQNQTLHSFKLLFSWCSSILWSHVSWDTLRYIKQKPTANLSTFLNCSWKTVCKWNHLVNTEGFWLLSVSQFKINMIVFLFSFSYTDAYVPNKKLLSRCQCSQSNLIIALLTFIVWFFFSSLLCCVCVETAHFLLPNALCWEFCLHARKPIPCHELNSFSIQHTGNCLRSTALLKFPVDQLYSLVNSLF